MRALIFFGLIAQLIALVLVNRSFQASLADALGRKNLALRYVVLVVGMVTGLVFLLPQAQALLLFGDINWGDMLLALSLGIALLLMLESCKLLLTRLRLNSRQ